MVEDRPYFQQLAVVLLGVAVASADEALQLMCEWTPLRGGL